MKVKGGNFKSTIELISQGRRSMTSIIFMVAGRRSRF